MGLKPRITFTKSASMFILNAIGMTLNEDNIIVYKSTEKPVLTKEGETVYIYEFAGFYKKHIIKDKWIKK